MYKNFKILLNLEKYVRYLVGYNTTFLSYQRLEHASEWYIIILQKGLITRIKPLQDYFNGEFEIKIPSVAKK